MRNQDSSSLTNVRFTAIAPFHLIPIARARARALKVIGEVEGGRSTAKAEAQVLQVRQVRQVQKVMTGRDAVNDHTTRMDVVIGLGVATITTLIALLKAMKGRMEVESGCIDTNRIPRLPRASPTTIERRSRPKDGKARVTRIWTLLGSMKSFMTVC